MKLAMVFPGQGSQSVGMLKGYEGLPEVAEVRAQAAAVHGGLRAQSAGQVARPGLLVALRGVELHCARIERLPGDLEGEAELLIHGEGGWHYAFRITHQGILLSQGRVAVMPGNGGGE